MSKLILRNIDSDDIWDGKIYYAFRFIIGSSYSINLGANPVLIYKVKAIRSGQAKITCKKKDNSIYATININIKCDHQRDLVNIIQPTCTKKGTKNFECKICNVKFQESINLIPHVYDFSFPGKGNKECKGICKFCKNTIKFIAPSKVSYFWRNDQTTESSYYNGSVPNDNPIGSNVVCWVQVKDGNKNFRDIVFEIDNHDILEVPEKFTEFTEFKVIGCGNVQITAYLKYNPNIKEVFNLEVGN